MAATTLADIVTPDCAPVAHEITLEYLKNCGEGQLWGSPLIGEDERAQEVAEGNSLMQAFPFRVRKSRVKQMNVLDTSNDTCPTPNGIGQGSMTMRKFSGHVSYGSEHAATFLQACEADDPLQVIMDELVNDDWRTIYEVMALSMCNGIYEHSETTLGGGAESIVYDCTDTAAATAAGTAALNKIHINNAKNSFSCDQLGGIIMHQTVATGMENMGLLSCPCHDDQGSAVYELDDGTSVTVIRDPDIKEMLETGTAGVFRSILYRRGAMLYGEGCHPKPLEVENDPCANNGDGAEVLHTRRRFVLHPDGHSFVGLDGNGGGFAAEVPTNAELEDGDVYTRSAPYDFQPIMFMESAA